MATFWLQVEFCTEQSVTRVVARRVLYMAGLLRYRWIKHPLFNAHSVQLKNTPYAHCMHFSHVKYACLQYNVDLKKQLETIVY